MKATVCLSLLAALLLPAAAARAEDQRFGDLVITSLPPLPGARGYGYVEHRFRISNLGRAVHRVRLRLPPDGPSLAGGWVQVERETLVPPGGTVEVAMAQPPLPLWATVAEVRIDGRRAEQGLRVDLGGAAYAAQTSKGLLLTTELVPPEALPFAGVAEVEVVRTPVPAAAWSASWLAYSGYAGIALGAAELASAPAPVREALHRYVEAGGVLMVLGRGPAAALLGVGGGPRPLAAGSTFEAWPAAFGLLLVAPAPGLTTAEVAELVPVLAGAERWADALPEPAAARQVVPVREPEVPVRGMFVAVLVFAFVAGPANLFVLARRGRKMWVLWTVPAVSLLATAAVVAWALLGEGMVRERNSLSLTLLDQGSRRAVTWALAGYYSTLTPSEGLRFSPDTEVSPLFGVNPGSGTLSVDWTSEQRLGRGWMVARFPLHVGTRRPQARRERLLVTREGEVVTVENALGAPLSRLLVADRDGYVFRATGGPIPPGGRRRLELVADRSANGGAALATGDLLASGLAAAVDRLERDPHVFLPPASYLAFLAGDPFVEPALVDAQLGAARAVVLGSLEGEV